MKLIFPQMVAQQRFTPFPRFWRMILLSLMMALFAIAPAPHQASAQGSNVPYALPVQIPNAKKSPPIDPAAPYTPLVLRLIAELEPNNPPTEAQLINMATI